MSALTCEICPHACRLEDGQTGFCRARVNRGGEIVCENYGKLTSAALDPIEKKPLRRFFPGSLILSVGSYGCNLRCPFCQNHEISMTDAQSVHARFFSPEQLAEQALSLRGKGNIGLAFTYNEPLISYEYVRDCAVLNHRGGLKNVLVTNGYVSEGPLRELLPMIDAMNIDLKGFTEDYYHTLGGDLETVERTISIAAASCHVELTTLVVPGKNDTPEEMEHLSRWVASVSPEIPLHVTRFFPSYRMAGEKPTPVASVRSLAQTASRFLRHVYMGNCSS